MHETLFGIDVDALTDDEFEALSIASIVTVDVVLGSSLSCDNRGLSWRRIDLALSVIRQEADTSDDRLRVMTGVLEMLQSIRPASEVLQP